MKTTDQRTTENTERKVLVVDDEVAERDIIALEFKMNGFRVSTAGGGRDAISQASRERPDAIILDLLMPGVNGFDVIARLRKSDDFAETAIIVRSGKSFKPDIDKALQMGADAYVTKPGELDELVRLTREAITKRTQ
jgi:DNA-binding response OmpR family regulator